MACGSRGRWNLSRRGAAPATRFPLAGLLIALALAGCSVGSPTAPPTGGSGPTQSPATGGSQGPANIGQASGVTWQTGDLSLATPFPIEQLVPIGDRLFLIASDNGGADPTAKPAGGIWSTADGLAWTKQSDIDAIKSSGTDRPTLMAASADGRGGAVVVGSEQTPDGSGRTAAWWTADGKTWAKATVEGPAGAMYSVVGRPDGLVAVGITQAGENAVPAAWRSTDGGSSWTNVSLPGGGMEARDVVVWGDKFVAIGRSADANLFLWASADGATWSVVESPSDASFWPNLLIPFGSTLVVLGHGVPGSAILTCGTDMKCARASMPDLGHTASFTEVSAGAEVSGTIVASTRSGVAGTGDVPASPGPSADPARALGFLASTDGRTWTTLKSSPSLVVVTSNIVIFKGRLVAMAYLGVDVTTLTVRVLVGDLR
jgi:hypothetical protein